jgi:hypothetical protein
MYSRELTFIEGQIQKLGGCADIFERRRGIWKSNAMFRHFAPLNAPGTE